MLDTCETGDVVRFNQINPKTHIHVPLPLPFGITRLLMLDGIASKLVYTPLMAAIRNGHINILRCCIASGFFEDIGMNNESALFFAVLAENCEMVSFLLANGASPLSTINNPIMLAAKLNSSLILTLLLSKIPSNASFQYSEEALIIAIESDSFDLMNVLLPLLYISSKARILDLVSKNGNTIISRFVSDWIYQTESGVLEEPLTRSIVDAFNGGVDEDMQTSVKAESVRLFSSHTGSVVKLFDVDLDTDNGDEIVWE
jgi:hypothetical protein